MEYPRSDLDFVLVYTRVLRRVCTVKSIQVTGAIFHGIPQDSITISCHATENKAANTISVDVHCNTVEEAKAFLYSYCLYFLWHGTN